MCIGLYRTLGLNCMCIGLYILCSHRMVWIYSPCSDCLDQVDIILGCSLYSIGSRYADTHAWPVMGSALESGALAHPLLVPARTDVLAAVLYLNSSQN